MQSAKRTIANMIRSPQYQKNIKILELLSKFRSRHGYEPSCSQISYNLHIPFTMCNRILAGDPKIPAKYYDWMIDYLNNRTANDL